MSKEKIYYEPLMQLIDRPAEVTAFLEEIDAVCRKHGFSLSNEDAVSDVLIERYSEENRQKLFNAVLNCEMPGISV